MQLCVKVLRPASGRSRVARLAIGRMGVGVSLQENGATMQVMLGVSLRARWDATLVLIILKRTTDATTSLSSPYDTVWLACIN